eukprot:Gregarina_sp_Poly_1__235@NODE_1054_length_5221_cov_28_606131_g247_i1_p1_GENE_NODE_1054_length_5221_cov_28_606131_g247_i1NODE_1054_length_5221_cov_28_606131_g247_i1_p1_ORF_typecomplete_len1049_score184_92Neur_chan_memb/PF02932_16/2_8e12Neur_chan_memb/PF02932_16/2e03Neur_chan_LBD/PF02931_23/3_9e10PMT_4TMC/PF16192_5/0_32PMT_4TMC/PF16192_5/56Sirohm_synth_C/PF14823_6/0_46MerC/PF03203_14/6_1e02MerC/PF03203_14/1_6_NODE_1054_length_5221_cov_28_606131_g247_i114464592
MVRVRLFWPDTRLLFDGPTWIEDWWSPSDFIPVPINSPGDGAIWVPYLALVNNLAPDLQETLNYFFPASLFDQTFLRAKGYNVYWARQLVLRAVCPPYVSMFPFDIQYCPFDFEIYGLPIERFTYSFTHGGFPAVVESSFPNEAEVWSVENAVVHPLSESMTDVTTNLRYLIILSRDPDYYISNFVWPLALVTLFGYLSFWLPFQMYDRVNLSVTILLAVFAIMFITADARPPLGHDTWLDIYQAGCIALSMIPAVETIIISRLREQLHRKNQQTESEWRRLRWLSQHAKTATTPLDEMYPSVGSWKPDIPARTPSEPPPDLERAALEASAYDIDVEPPVADPFGKEPASGWSGGGRESPVASMSRRRSLPTVTNRLVTSGADIKRARFITGTESPLLSSLGGSSSEPQETVEEEPPKNDFRKYSVASSRETMGAMDRWLGATLPKGRTPQTDPFDLELKPIYPLVHFVGGGDSSSHNTTPSNATEDVDGRWVEFQAAVGANGVWPQVKHDVDQFFRLTRTVSTPVSHTGSCDEDTFDEETLMTLGTAGTMETELSRRRPDSFFPSQREDQSSMVLDFTLEANASQTLCTSEVLHGATPHFPHSLSSASQNLREKKVVRFRSKASLNPLINSPSVSFSSDSKLDSEKSVSEQPIVSMEHSKPVRRVSRFVPRKYESEEDSDESKETPTKSSSMNSAMISNDSKEKTPAFRRQRTLTANSGVVKNAFQRLKTIKDSKRLKRAQAIGKEHFVGSLNLMINPDNSNTITKMHPKSDYKKKKDSDLSKRPESSRSRFLSKDWVPESSLSQKTKGSKTVIFSSDSKGASQTEESEDIGTRKQTVSSVEEFALSKRGPQSGSLSIPAPLSEKSVESNSEDEDEEQPLDYMGQGNRLDSTNQTVDSPPVLQKPALADPTALPNFIDRMFQIAYPGLLLTFFIERIFLTDIHAPFRVFGKDRVSVLILAYCVISCLYVLWIFAMLSHLMVAFPFSRNHLGYQLADLINSRLDRAARRPPAEQIAAQSPPAPSGAFGTVYATSAGVGAAATRRDSIL